jgi:hypothetical protein
VTPGVEIVGGFAEYEWEENPDAVGEENADCACGVTPAVAFQVRQQRAQRLRQHAGLVVDEILAV